MPRPAPVTIATLPSKSPIDPVPLCGLQCGSARLASQPRSATTADAGYRPPMADVTAELPRVPRRWRSSSTSRSSTATSTGRTTRAGRSPTHLYGGQVAAQALRAAGLTVPEGRHPHSMHCYYLRVGRGRAPHDHAGEPRPRRPVVLGPAGRGAAARARRSSPCRRRSTSTRRAVTGRACRCRRTSRRPRSSTRRATTASAAARSSWTCGGRPADRHPGRAAGRRGGCGRRTREPLPDDRVLHAAAIVYLSDMSSGFVDLDVPGFPRGGSSLDHTMYFHRPARADDWMFMELEPVSAAGARASTAARCTTANGRLLATLVQENLMRPPPPERG